MGKLTVNFVCSCGVIKRQYTGWVQAWGRVSDEVDPVTSTDSNQSVWSSPLDITIVKLNECLSAIWSHDDLKSVNKISKATWVCCYPVPCGNKYQWRIEEINIWELIIDILLNLVGYRRSIILAIVDWSPLGNINIIPERSNNRGRWYKGKVRTTIWCTSVGPSKWEYTICIHLWSQYSLRLVEVNHNS